jgi:hypothetical protein
MRKINKLAVGLGLGVYFFVFSLGTLVSHSSGLLLGRIDVLLYGASLIGGVTAGALAGRNGFVHGAPVGSFPLILSLIMLVLIPQPTPGRLMGLGYALASVIIAGCGGVIGARFLPQPTLLRTLSLPSDRPLRTAVLTSLGGLTALILLFIAPYLNLPTRIIFLAVGLLSIGYGGRLWWIHRRTMEPRRWVGVGFFLLAGSALLVGGLRGVEVPAVRPALVLGWLIGVILVPLLLSRMGTKK